MVSRMMETKSEYKMTEVGEIPIDWEVNKLKSIGKFSSGTGFPEKYQGGKDSKDIPFFKVSDMNLKGNEVNMIVSNNYVNSQAIAKIKAKVIDKKSIIFAKVGAAIFLERKRKVSSPFLIDNNMMAFSSDKSIDFNYLYYLFSRIRLSKYAQVGALPSYNASDIGNIKVAYPESSLEQQKIAEILSTVDEQIDQTDQLIEKTKELKKGLMQQLLTKGIGHTEFKQTELGEIPGEWEVTSLKNLGSFFKGKGIAKKDMSTNGYKCILYGQLYTTYKEIINEVDTYTDINIKNPVIGEKNDLLIPSSGETPFDIATASSLQVNEVYIGGDINVFRPANQMNSDFLSYQINSVRKFELSKLAQGSSIYHLYKDNLEKFDVLVPQLKEQKQIVEILSAVEEDIEGYQQEKSKYEELKKGLMQQLLTGKTRVKVD